MKTFYVLFDKTSRLYVRAGKTDGYTYILSNAKHFTSVWSAKRHARSISMYANFEVIKICHQ